MPPFYHWLFFFLKCYGDHRDLHSFPTRRSSDLKSLAKNVNPGSMKMRFADRRGDGVVYQRIQTNLRSEEYTSELQSRFDLVCRLLLEKKKKTKYFKKSLRQFSLFV